MRQLTTRLFLAFLCLLGITANQMVAQERYVPWRFGAHAGVNINLAGVGYGLWQLDRGAAGHFIPLILNDGSGIGPYFGLNAEYVSTSFWGIQLRASYDSRTLTTYDDQSWPKPAGGFFKDEFAFHNQYISIEPRFRFQPFTSSAFHITAGPSISFAMNTKYDYTPEGGQTIADQELPDAKSMTYAIAGGIGYDISVSDRMNDMQYMISPFIEWSWLLAQRGVDFADLQGSFDDALSTNTIRVGVAVKLGKAKDDLTQPEPPKAFFDIYPPEDGIMERTVVEEFYPLLPYVFFDRGDTTIPSRYIKLSDADIANFPNLRYDAQDLTDVNAREFRQGEVYYNVMNIYAARLASNPNATVTLVGSAPVEKDGEVLARQVRDYLVNNWKIAPNRINVKGQVDPNIISGTARTPDEDKPAAEIENRRVEFQFSDSKLLREAHFFAQRKAVFENDVRIELNTNESIESWTVRVKGNNVDRTYGPYTSDEEVIPSAGLLGTASQGAFTAEVVARTTDNRTLGETRPFSLRTSAEARKSSRFSIVFNYGEDDPVRRYESFLKNEAADRIPDGATVFVHGHTDNLGKDDVNLKLSVQRAQQAKKVLDAGVKAKGKNNVRIIAVGRGEVTASDLFSNDVPEGRQYNRTVVLDVIPKR